MVITHQINRVIIPLCGAEPAESDGLDRSQHDMNPQNFNTAHTVLLLRISTD